MDRINTSGFNHKPDVIKNSFEIVNKTTKVNKDIYVLFPEDYVNKKLAILSNVVKLISIYAIVDDDENYAVCVAPVFQELTPINVDIVIVNEEKHYRLTFSKDSVFIPNNNLLVTDNYFYVAGKIPWFLEYNQLSNLLIESNKYANSNIGNNMLTFEILTSIIARDSKDLLKYYRLTLKSKEDLNNKPKYVGMNNIFYSLDNTGAKLIGSYFKKGLVSSLADPEEKSSKLTKILRK
jgi:hypothetical protein